VAHRGQRENQQGTRRTRRSRPGQIGDFLKVLDSGKGANKVTASALKLMLYTDLRDGALRAAEWKEIDFDATRWTVPAQRMKRRGKEERQEHAVPLSTQTLAVLREVQDYTGHGPESFVFASTGKSGFLAENTLLRATAVIRAAGWE